jgi:drug/metabolite transporter (DMT)-like permease
LSYAGVPLTLVAATAYNSGLILEKRALEQMPSIDVRRVFEFVRSLLTTPAWLGGFTLILLGLGCQFVVLSIEPLTIAQPLLAGGVAIVLVLSRVVLRERLGGGALWCLAALAVSVVLLSMSAGGGRGGSGRYANILSVAAVAVPSVLLAMLIYKTAARAAGRRHRAPVTGVAFGFGTGLMYGVAALGIKGLSGIFVRHQSLGHMAAAIAGSPYLYMLGGCALAGFGLFQSALQRCRASIVVPVNNIAGSVYFVLVGSWLFHEHLPTDPLRLALRAGGILAACSVLLLLPKQASTATAAGKPRRSRRAPLPASAPALAAEMGVQPRQRLRSSRPDPAAGQP